MMSVPVVTRAEGVEFGTPETLFDHQLSTTDFGYDVSPDGKRFLIETRDTHANRLALTLVTNWAAGLKK